jgi:hypothetical protein
MPEASETKIGQPGQSVATLAFRREAMKEIRGNGYTEA